MFDLMSVLVKYLKLECKSVCRILKLMENSVSSFNMEEFLEDQRRKCSHDSSPYFQVNKTMTLGKVELQVQVFLSCDWSSYLA